MSTSPMSLDERRRRRDQRMAVETANQIVQDAASRGRTVTLEWAAVATLLGIGVAAVLSTLYRSAEPKLIGSAAWSGIVLGGLVCDAILQGDRRTRLTHFLLALFAGLPLAAIPFRFFPPHRADLPMLSVAVAGAAVFAAAARWAWSLRASFADLGDAAANTRAGMARGGSAVSRWLHDAFLKWIAAVFLLVAGAAVIFFSRQLHQPRLFWVGMGLVFLVGSVGLWMPGLHARTRLAVGLRHCGQLCFWFSLLIVPFIEEGPEGSLPYVGQTSWRLAAMGVGLAVIGLTWTLQRTSIFSHHSVPERKSAPETIFALAVVALGLIVALAGINARQRMRFVVDDTTVSQTNIVGSLHFQPDEAIASVLIIQPIDVVPFYIDEVTFQDGSTFRTLPLLFAGDQLHADQHPLILALRSAGHLDRQTFPQSRTELWSR